jgi:hypothetical protein
VQHSAAVGVKAADRMQALEKVPAGWSSTLATVTTKYLPARD